jgi:hypothetical protein
MRKILVLLALVLPTLISCGGGGGSNAGPVTTPTVSLSVLANCASGQLMNCLAGKVSLGKDANGVECGVRFSTDGFDIVSLLLNPHVQYQPANAQAADMNYVFAQSYTQGTGALNFTVTAQKSGAPYFSFGFSGNTKTGGGNILLDVSLVPDVAGAPAATLQCTVVL